MAYHADNLAALYVAACFGWGMTVLHAIEVKLNKLLDDRGIVVRSEDLDEKW